MRSFVMNIFSGNVVSKDVLKSLRNLLQGGDRTSAKELYEDLDILWASKGGNVDLSKWSKDDFSNDYINCKYFAGKPVATNNFGLQRKSFTDTFCQQHFSIWRLKKNFGHQLAPAEKS